MQNALSILCLTLVILVPTNSAVLTPSTTAQLTPRELLDSWTGGPSLASSSRRRLMKAGGTGQKLAQQPANTQKLAQQPVTVNNKPVQQVQVGLANLKPVGGNIQLTGVQQVSEQISFSTEGQVFVQRQFDLGTFQYQEGVFQPVLKQQKENPTITVNTFFTELKKGSRSEALKLSKSGANMAAFNAFLDPGLMMDVRAKTSVKKSASEIIGGLKAGQVKVIRDFSSGDKAEVTAEMKKALKENQVFKTGDVVMDLNLNFQQNVRETSRKQGGTAKNDLDVHYDVFKVCHNDNIRMVLKYRDEMKQVAEQVGDLKPLGRGAADFLVGTNKKLDPAPGTWMDHYIVYAYLQADPLERKNVGVRLQSSVSKLSEALGAYITYLQGVMQTRVHIYGTTWLDYRTRFIIGSFRKLFAWPAIEASKAVSNAGYNLFYEALQIVKVEKGDYTSLALILQKDYQIKSGIINAQSYPFLGTQVATWTGYPAAMDSLKLMLCKNVQDVVYLFCGRGDMKTVALQLQGSYDKTLADQKVGQKLEHAQQIFTDFGNLLDAPNRPEGCGDGGAKSLRDTIQFGKIGQVISGLGVFKEETTFFGEDFFSFIRSGAVDVVGIIIELDYLLLRRTYDSSSFFNLLRYVHLDIVFHPDFFQDLHSVTFKEYMGTAKELKVIDFKQIDYFSQYFRWSTLERATREAGGDMTAYYANVLVYIYKLYVILRAQKLITSTSTNAQIYMAMFGLIQNIKQWGANGDFWGGFFLRAHFSQYYFSVITFICDKIGNNYCEGLKQDEFKQQFDNIVPTPDVDPIPPAIKDRVYIIKVLITIIKELVIKNKLKEFFDWWISQDWTLKDCGRRQRQEVLGKREFKTVEVLGQKVQKEITRDYILYTDGCTSTLFEAIRTKLTTFLADWEGNFIDFWNFFFVLIQERVDLRREVTRYILLRIVRYYIKHPEEGPKGKMLQLIFKLISVYEGEVTQSLNYLKTAGFYGYFDMLTNDYQITGTYFDMYFDTRQVDLHTLWFDSYYLTYIAYLNTNVKAIPSGKQDLWRVNTFNMLQQHERQWSNFAVPGKSPTYTLESFRQNIHACRENLVHAGPLNKAEILLLEECTSDATDTRKKTDCWMVANDYSRCKPEFALQMLAWMLTAKVMVKSVGVFDHFNYFHHYYLPSSDGVTEDNPHGTFAKDVRNKKFFEAIYKHLQDVRLNIEGQFDDVRNYVINKVVTCAEKSGVAVKPVDLGESRCVFAPNLYGNIYWLLKHTYLVNFPGAGFNLEGWNPANPPMGTFNYMVLLTNYPPMNRDFESLCNEVDEPTLRAPICKIKYMIEFWVSELAENGDSSGKGIDGVDAFEGIFGLQAKAKAKAVQQVQNAKLVATFSVEKFYLLEAFHCMHQLMLQDLSQLNRLKSVMNYYDQFKIGANGQSVMMDFYATSKAFEFNKDTINDEIGVMAAFLKFNYQDTSVDKDELLIRTAVITLLEGSTITVTQDADLTTAKGLLELLTTYNNIKQLACLRFLLTYASNDDHYKKISTLLANRNQFLDAVVIEIKNDVIVRLKQTMAGEDCKANPVNCFVGFVSTNNFDQIAMIEFELERSLGLGNNEPQIDIDIKSPNSDAKMIIDGRNSIQIGFEIGREKAIYEMVGTLKTQLVVAQTETKNYYVEEESISGGQGGSNVYGMEQGVQFEFDQPDLDPLEMDFSELENDQAINHRIGELPDSEVKREDVTQAKRGYSAQDPSVYGQASDFIRGGHSQVDEAKNQQNELLFMRLDLNVPFEMATNLNSNQELNQKMMTMLSANTNLGKLGYTSFGNTAMNGEEAQKMASKLIKEYTLQQRRSLSSI